MSRKAGYQRARRARLKAAAAAGGGSAGTTQETKKTGKTTVVGTIREGAFDADNPKALEELRAMAARGEIPERITGSREAQARLYEEIDKLYGDPPGALGDYQITYRDAGNNIEIEYNKNFARGEEPSIRVPRRGKATESEVNGVLKQALYANRPYLEALWTWRGDDGFWGNNGRGGQPNPKWRYNDKMKSDYEKAMRSEVVQAFGSPFTAKGLKLIGDFFKKDDQGRWYLKGLQSY